MLHLYVKRAEKINEADEKKNNIFFKKIIESIEYARDCRMFETSEYC